MDGTLDAGKMVKESLRSAQLLDELMDRSKKMKESGIELRSNKTMAGVFMFVADPNIPFPFQLAEKLTQHAREQVRLRGGWGWGDECFLVAKDENKGWGPDDVLAKGTIYGKYPDHIVRSQGFRSHTLNYIYVQLGEQPVHVAYDLTAGYNVDGDQRNYSVIAFAAHSSEELRSMLEQVYEFELGKG